MDALVRLIVFLIMIALMIFAFAGIVAVAVVIATIFAIVIILKFSWRWMGSMWIRARCALGSHRNLEIIQEFGTSRHVGCPHCGAEFGMHDGARAFLPWNDEFEQLYIGWGKDVKGHRMAWRRRRFGLRV